MRRLLLPPLAVMRAVPFFHATLLALCVSTASAAGTTSLLQAAPAALAFAFQVLDGEGSRGVGSVPLVDIGAVSAKSVSGRSNPILVKRRVAVRLDGAAAMARVSVSLVSETPGCTIRIDGQPIGSIPRVVDPLHRVGSTVVHQLELSIPAGVPAGAFLSNLQWLAETN